MTDFSLFDYMNLRVSINQIVSMGHMGLSIAHVAAQRQKAGNSLPCFVHEMERLSRRR